MQPVDISALPKRIRQLRLELGWSMDDLARAVGAAGKGVVSNWEATTGERQRTPPLETLLAITRWYGVSLDYLVGVRGADRDSPLVKIGKAALRERFPTEVKRLTDGRPGARLRLAISILQEASPEAFFTGRIAANLLLTEERLRIVLEHGEVTGPLLESFARFADIPPAWFHLRPDDI